MLFPATHWLDVVGLRKEGTVNGRLGMGGKGPGKVYRPSVLGVSAQTPLIPCISQKAFMQGLVAAHSTPLHGSTKGEQLTNGNTSIDQKFKMKNSNSENVSN